VIYVYGVLRRGRGAEVAAAGVEQAPIRGVAHGDLVALVSDLDGTVLAAAREVRAHWAVLDEVARSVTVLPVRFGTVLDDDDAVRASLLEPSAERITELLRVLDGRVQLNVRAHYDEEQLLADVVRASPNVAAMRERIKGLPEQAAYYQRIRLGELVAGEVARARENDARRALEALDPHAVASRVEEPRGGDGAFALAFLVERGAVDAFGAAVARLREESGERLRIRFVGPLPPYSFVDDELRAGSPAWA
jgi:hypothetical protein